MNIPGPESAKRAARSAESAAEQVAEHPVLEALARAGFVVSGLVHAPIGGIALALATGPPGGGPAQPGALRAAACASPSAARAPPSSRPIR